MKIETHSFLNEYFISTGFHLDPIANLDTWEKLLTDVGELTDDQIYDILYHATDLNEIAVWAVYCNIPTDRGSFCQDSKVMAYLKTAVHTDYSEKFGFKNLDEMVYHLEELLKERYET